MFSPQTQQALRVLRWRATDHVEDAARTLLRRPLPVPPPSGRPAPMTETEMDDLIERHGLSRRVGARL